MKKPQPVWICVIVIASSIGVASCGGESPAGPQGEENSDPTVSVGDNFFNANSVSIGAGETVRWVWAGNVFHNVTFDGPGQVSATQRSGDYDRTFPNEGTFSYHCTVHGAANMAGVVNVGAPGTGSGIY